MSPQTQNSGLTVRQHEREGIAVPVEFIVNAAHGGQVRFSTSSSAWRPNVIRCEAIDISSGGMGLKTRQFVPRMCEGIVRVFCPLGHAGTDPSEMAAHIADSECMFEQPIKIRRVVQIGREPTYSLGAAFLEAGPVLDQQISVLFNRIASARAGATATRSSTTGGPRA